METSSSAPTGVGGWLRLIVIWFAVLWPLSAIGSLGTMARTFPSAFDFAGSTLVSSLLAGAAMYTAVALGQRWSGAPAMAQRFMLLAVVIAAFDIPDFMKEGQALSYALGRFVGGTAWVLVLFLYFRRSGRVRNTYGAHGVAAPAKLKATALGVTATLVVLIAGASLLANMERSLDQIAESLTPYEFVTVTRPLAPATFDSGMSDAALTRLKQAVPQATFKIVGSPRFVDTGRLATSRMTYEGILPAAEGSTAFSGEMQWLYHKDGVVSLESACVPNLGDCSPLTRLMADAESALSSRLADVSVEGILPTGSCAVDTIKDEKVSAVEIPVMTCSYGTHEEVTLALSRIDAAHFQRTIQSSLTLDATSKRAVARASRRTPAPK